MGNEQQPARTAGRPAIGEKVETRLPEDLARRVDYYAARTSRSRADALRVLIAASVDRVVPDDLTLPTRVAPPVEQPHGYLLAQGRVRMLHRRHRDGETSLRLHVEAAPSIGTPDMGDRGPELAAVSGAVIGIPESPSALAALARNLADIAETLDSIAKAKTRAGGGVSNAKVLADLAQQYNLGRSATELTQDGDQ